MASYSAMITCPLRARRHFPRRPQPHARLEPRRVEQPDEQERQHHQQEHDAREQHDDAEDAADVARERDVAEPERRHHDERPVEAGDPRVLLVLDVELDDVEQHRVDARPATPRNARYLPSARRFARASRSVVRYASWLGMNFISGSTATALCCAPAEARARVRIASAQDSFRGGEDRSPIRGNGQPL